MVYNATFLITINILFTFSLRFRVSPVSKRAEGTEAGLCPRILSSSLKNLQDFLPLPVLLSLISLYFVFKFFYFCSALFPVTFISLFLKPLRNSLINNFVVHSPIQFLSYLGISPDGQKGLYLLIFPGGTAVCLSHASRGKWFAFEAVQLFTRNAQAPKPPLSWFKTTSEGGLREPVT